MSFPRYPKYKDSDVEWLGEVPEHWSYVSVWLLFEMGRGRVISHEEIMDNQGEFPVYSSQTENDGCMGKLATFDFEGEYLTWTTDGANAGTVFRRSGRFNCTNVCGTLKPKSDELNLDYAVHSVGISTAYFVRHDINPKLMNNVMGKIRIPVPPCSEQIVIASFLNHETAKIDELVAEQRRLIELLKEKRQAVISHAVTKGLNPNVPLKPSGIEWLGDVPEHWTRSQPKYFTSKIVDGVHFKPNYVDEGIPFVTVQNLTAGRGISFENLNYITREDHDEYFKRANPQKGDVLITKDGTLGVVRVVETDRVFSIFVSVALLKPIRESIDPWFMAHALESDVVYQQFSARQLGSALKHIHLVELRNIFVMLPPLEEQHEIVLMLREETGRLETLLAEAERAVELLQERRTALISAAVTGKIDVRRFNPSGS
jgi:type I restriction enzyme S subunit